MNFHAAINFSFWIVEFLKNYPIARSTLGNPDHQKLMMQRFILAWDLVLNMRMFGDAFFAFKYTLQWPTTNLLVCRGDTLEDLQTVKGLSATLGLVVDHTTNSAPEDTARGTQVVWSTSRIRVGTLAKEGKVLD